MRLGYAEYRSRQGSGVSTRQSDQVSSLKRVLLKRMQLWSGKTQSAKHWDEAYWPQNFVAPTFRAPVVLFKRPKRPYYFIDDSLLGWGARSNGGVETHEVNANHHEVLREPHVQTVSKILTAHLHPSSNRVERPAVSGTIADASNAVPSY